MHISVENTVTKKKKKKKFLVNIKPLTIQTVTFPQLEKWRLRSESSTSNTWRAASLPSLMISSIGRTRFWSIIWMNSSWSTKRSSRTSSNGIKTSLNPRKRSPRANDIRMIPIFPRSRQRFRLVSATSSRLSKKCWTRNSREHVYNSHIAFSYREDPPQFTSQVAIDTSDEPLFTPEEIKKDIDVFQETSPKYLQRNRILNGLQNGDHTIMTVKNMPPLPGTIGKLFDEYFEFKMLNNKILYPLLIRLSQEDRRQLSQKFKLNFFFIISFFSFSVDILYITYYFC